MWMFAEEHSTSLPARAMEIRDTFTLPRAITVSWHSLPSPVGVRKDERDAVAVGERVRDWGPKAVVKSTSFMCKTCGHSFSLRKTRDIHQRVCATAQASA